MPKPSLEERVEKLEKSVSKWTLVSGIIATLGTVAVGGIAAVFNSRIASVQASASVRVAEIQSEVEKIRSDSAQKLEAFRTAISAEQKALGEVSTNLATYNDSRADMPTREMAFMRLASSTLQCNTASQVAATFTVLGNEPHCNSFCDHYKKDSAIAGTCFDACTRLSKQADRVATMCERACPNTDERSRCNHRSNRG